MKSGNLGVVTVGTGTIFGAQALATANSTTTDHAEHAELAETKRLCRFHRFCVRRRDFIDRALYRAVIEPAEKPPGHVCDDHHFPVSRFVLDDGGVAVDACDSLAVGGVGGVEGQRNPADV